MFLYLRNVFSLLLKMVFCRDVEVGSLSVCCRDVLVLSCFSLAVVNLDISKLDSVVDE